MRAKKQRELQQTIHMWKRLLLIICNVAAGLSLLGCATVQLGSIPKPVETTQLRVAVIPFSGNLSKKRWGKSNEEFVDSQYRNTLEQLDKLGYYDVVSVSEMYAVLGEYAPDRWSLTRKDAELALRIGVSLYADYVLLAERGTLGDPNYYFELTLININSGRRFAVRINNTRERGAKKLPKGTARIAMRELFRDAKGDLLATALSKISGKTIRKTEHGQGREEPEEAPKKTEHFRLAAEREEQNRLDREQLVRIKNNEQKLAAASIVSNDLREVEYLDAEQQEEHQLRGAKRLIVYDLSTASDAYRQVALILSEALREEIQKRGVYNLVNRENILQLLNEMKFQQSGLVDSTQAVQLGKGAGAQEIVTGNLGVLGRKVVLQSKLTDIQSMLNLVQASLKCEAGQEELLLDRLSNMVDQLLNK